MIVINKMVCSVQWCCNHCVKNRSITVNKYRFCISVIGHINNQIIGIGSRKSISVESLILTLHNASLIYTLCACFVCYNERIRLIHYSIAKASNVMLETFEHKHTC